MLASIFRLTQSHHILTHQPSEGRRDRLAPSHLPLLLHRLRLSLLLGSLCLLCLPRVDHLRRHCSAGSWSGDARCVWTSGEVVHADTVGLLCLADGHGTSGD